MASLNKVMLIGNLTRDPDMKFTPQGTAVCKFSIACGRKWKGKDGENNSETTFVNIVVWGKQGENCGKFLAKGRPVFIEGRLDIRQYEKDGVKKNAVEVVAEMVQFLGSSSGGSAKKDSPATQADAQGEGWGSPEGQGSAGTGAGADDVPF